MASNRDISGWVARAGAAMLIVAILGEGSPAVAEVPVGTAITYQGELQQGGSPVDEPMNGCDFQFSLWDDGDPALPENQVGATITKTVLVEDGRFTTALDFGDDIFTGKARWLEIAVCCPSSCTPGAPLTPRQELTPAPYSLRAGNGVGGPDALNVDAAGNVGIGTTNPASRLDVVGAAPVSGTGVIQNQAGSTTVLGAGTSFQQEVHVGDALINLGNAQRRLVVAITSNTELTTQEPFDPPVFGNFEFQQPIIHLADSAGQTVFRIDAQGAGLGIVPVGSIIAWHRDIKDPVGGTDPLSLPNGWVQCDGQTLSDPESPLNGQAIPDLNGQGRFLRGSSTGISGQMEADEFKSHRHNVLQGAWLSAGGTADFFYGTGAQFGQLLPFTANTGGAETRPVNMSVVWIMRVK